MKTVRKILRKFITSKNTCNLGKKDSVFMQRIEDLGRDLANDEDLDSIFRGQLPFMYEDEATE